MRAESLLRLLPLAFALSLLGGCWLRQPEPQVVDGVRYGVTQETFRHRWWHYYDRGVSWASGGFWAEAESDLRWCLALRQSDSRRARSYGMHFVQCFAHRELGAVLLQQGRLAEAEVELRRSLEAGPRSKARVLLERVQRLQVAARQAEGLVDPEAAADLAVAAAQPAQPALPAAEPDPAANLIVDAVTAEGDGRLTVRGRLEALVAEALYRIDLMGVAHPVPIAADGSFSLAMPQGESLAAGHLGAATGESLVPLLTPEPPPPQVELVLDGLTDGAVLFAPQLWIRFEARADSPLRELRIASSDQVLAQRPLSGVQAGGMIQLRLAEGGHRLEFLLDTTSGQQARVQMAVDVRPSPEHRPALRAPALVLPLQIPSSSAERREEDDPRFLTALSDDGRFRLIDLQADELLERELDLVDAGYVDRVTAASAGRRQAARYVVAGTLRRAGSELECYCRLIHSETGRVVATADAYAPKVARDETLAFFVIAAKRLRQAFPVVAGSLQPLPEQEALVLGLGVEAGIAERMRFHILEAEPDLVDPASGRILMPGRKQAVGMVEIVHVEDALSRGVLIDGRMPVGTVEGVSE
jgi:hypothetical protein